MENKHFSFQYQAPLVDVNILIGEYILNELPVCAQKLRKKLSSFRKRQGGLSGVTLQVILKFICFCRYAKYLLGLTTQWLKSVKDLAILIYSDSILRMNWEFAISRSEQTLKKYKGLEVLDIIDSALKIGPKFSESELVGFPINSIFIEFMQTENGRAFFSNEKVNLAFKTILNDYGKMLDSPESLRYMNREEGGWFSPQAQEKIDYSQYDCDPKADHFGFKNWNQWFLRKFREGKRPIGNDYPQGVPPENVIINSCESTPLTFPLQPCKNVKLVDHFWLKDDKYSLVDMFGPKHLNKQHYAIHFAGGTVYQAFLSALNYHRWHSPVDGMIEDIYNIEGTYLFDQSQFLPEFDQGSPNNSQSFLSAVAARQVFIINTFNDLIGKIAIIFIGMAEVSSCVATVDIGKQVKKGQQIGNFAFGGSSHTIIFEQKAKLTFADTLYTNDNDGNKKGKQQLLHSFLAYVQ